MVKPQANLLLAALGARARELLEPHLERVDLRIGDSLSFQGKAIRTACFPDSGLISLIHTYRDGSAAEVGLIGREGFWGLSLVLEGRSSPFEAVVQGAGQARCISAKALKDVMASNPEVRSQLFRYANYMIGQVAITAACNGRHQLSQRLARWLLEAHDRLGSDIEVKHELLGQMLGVRRAGITSALAAFKADGCITPRRGRIHIQSRKGIEGRVCECYDVVKAEYRRMLALPKVA